MIAWSWAPSPVPGEGGETECGRDDVAHLLDGAGTHRAEERF